MGGAAAFNLNALVMRTTKTRRGRRLSDSGDLDSRENIAVDALVRMRESNHRIKNNLQVLMSLLAMQSRQSEEEAARVALLDACARVAAVGRLHERLEAAEFEDRVDVALFVNELCSDLRTCFASVGLTLEANVEPAHLPAKAALPVGMMVSELVTNAVKHAGATGAFTVRVSLRKEAGGWHLKVVDDGPGMEADALHSRARSGGRLLFALARQLGGSIEIDEAARGASISVRFPG
jgi:two-component sensor histidine kinase